LRLCAGTPLVGQGLMTDSVRSRAGPYASLRFFASAQYATWIISAQPSVGEIGVRPRGVLQRWLVHQTSATSRATVVTPACVVKSNPGMLKIEQNTLGGFFDTAEQFSSIGCITRTGSARTRGPRRSGSGGPSACPIPWSNGRPKSSDTAKWAPLFVQRALGPRSRIAIAVWYSHCRVRFCRSVISGSRGRSIGRGVMNRKTAALFLFFGAGLLFAALGIGANLVPMAAAQMPNICPPGQTFVIAQGGCVARSSPLPDARRARSWMLRPTAA
jgi:hypothetical protein